MKPRSGTRHRPAATAIPVFSLYGEIAAIDAGDFVHIEEIRSRSERYGWEIAPHQHRGLFQVLAVIDGAARLQLDGRWREIEGPCVLTVPPTVVHAFRFRRGTHGFVLTIAEPMLRQAESRSRQLFATLFVTPVVVSFDTMPQDAGRIAALMEQIAAEARDPLPGRTLMHEWLVGAVLMLIARQRASETRAAGTDSRRLDLFNRFRTLIEERFLDHWTVPRYAEALRMTEGRLNRLSRAIAGRSAYEVIQDRMITEARRRLVYIAAPVSLIAYELGFEDPAYFSRIFKKRTGLTPSAFRRREGERIEPTAG